MRRLFCVLTAVFLCVSLAISVSAATGASSVTGYATVEQGGGCQVSLTVNLHLEEATTGLTFPVPGDASGVLLNGARVSTTRSGGVRQVNLNRVTRNVVGDVTVNIQYSLRDVIHAAEDGTYQLRLPLLSGFQYPIEHMEFSVTMPAPLQIQPSFQSGYHQSSIEEYLQYDISGPTVTGKTLQPLKDHETLSMTMQVDETMFPRNFAQTRDYTWSEMAMAACGILAILYWIVTMWNRPGFAKLQAEPPQGFSAGALGNLLTLGGMDMTMMVLSWAQLGYILIHLDDSGRVMLHKRMDMGNERSGYEIRTFRSLFGKRSIVDGTGYHYANLYRKVAATQADIHALYRRSTGNPLVFRALCALIGLFGGISIGIALVGDALLGILLIAILAVLGAVSAWFIQNWALGLHMRYRFSLLIGLGLGGIWLLIGAAAGVWYVSVGMVAAQLIGGLACAYGGKRTPFGRQTVSEFLGLRSYLKHFPATEVRRLCAADPAYYFSLAPYAIALGVGRPFAARFGNMRLPACPYLATGMDAHLTAAQWHLRFTEVISALDLRQKRLPIERLLGR